MECSRVLNRSEIFDRDMIPVMLDLLRGQSGTWQLLLGLLLSSPLKSSHPRFVLELLLCWKLVARCASLLSLERRQVPTSTVLKR
jgi:hypothetical protein